jgi:membrane-bound metal-dependent hydrolase YbcI (DUF457 family)
MQGAYIILILMPFTPFHFGPPFLIGMLFVNQVNMAAILFTSVAVDIEPIYCLISNTCGLHGILHTYLGAAAFSLALGGSIIYFCRKQLKRISDALGIVQDYSLTSILIGALIGGWSHVFLDSFMYSDIVPFWPIDTNPFLGIISNENTYLVTIVGFVGGAILYFWKLRSILKAEKAGS